jgi:hypothetical protein
VLSKLVGILPFNLFPCRSMLTTFPPHPLDGMVPVRPRLVKVSVSMPAAEVPQVYTEAGVSISLMELQAGSVQVQLLKPPLRLCRLVAPAKAQAVSVPAPAAAKDRRTSRSSSRTRKASSIITAIAVVLSLTRDTCLSGGTSSSSRAVLLTEDLPRCEFPIPFRTHFEVLNTIFVLS